MGQTLKKKDKKYNWSTISIEIGRVWGCSQRWCHVKVSLLSRINVCNTYIEGCNLSRPVRNVGIIYRCLLVCRMGCVCVCLGGGYEAFSKKESLFHEECHIYLVCILEEWRNQSVGVTKETMVSISNLIINWITKNEIILKLDLYIA